MEFINKCIDYLKANPFHAIIIGAAAAFILIVLIVIISLSCKRNKAKKRIAKEQAAKAQAEARAKAEREEAEAKAKAKAEEEARKLAAKKAVEDKLEAQRIIAEREEADRKAKEEADRVAAEAAEKARMAEEAQAKAKAAAAAEAKAQAKVAAAEKAAQKAREKAERERLAAEEAKKQAEQAEEIKKQTPLPEKRTANLYDELVQNYETETEKSARYSGKWTIFRLITDDQYAEETFFFELHASNGEKLLSSEEYTSYAGAVRGIQTHKTNIEKNNFKITLSKKGDYIFKLLSGKNLLLCMGEHYTTKARCESAIESTIRFAKTAVIDETVQDCRIKVPVEDDTEIEPLQDGYNGKWIIECREAPDGERVFYFELFANNGEKLLSSEEYTTYIGAVNGIQTHKTNIERGNFRISLTKRGDYIYKLLNGNGQLLCLGEHYATKRRCQNAVESVKRFAANSPILTDPEHTK